MVYWGLPFMGIQKFRFGKVISGAIAAFVILGLGEYSGSGFVYDLTNGVIPINALRMVVAYFSVATIFYGIWWGVTAIRDRI